MANNELEQRVLKYNEPIIEINKSISDAKKGEIDRHSGQTLLFIFRWKKLHTTKMNLFLEWMVSDVRNMIYLIRQLIQMTSHDIKNDESNFRQIFLITK